MNEYRCKRIAREYFWPELGGKNKPGWVLHHIDPSWKTEDPERYHQWNIEDLIPMTFSEHTRWHIENDPEFIFGKTGEKNPMFGIHRYGENNPFFNKHHSAESKKKMSEAKLGKYAGEKNPMFGRTGEKNPVFGTHWYNNGEICVRAKECPPGFVKGRLI